MSWKIRLAPITFRCRDEGYGTDDDPSQQKDTGEQTQWHKKVEHTPTTNGISGEDDDPWRIEGVSVTALFMARGLLQSKEARLLGIFRLYTALRINNPGSPEWIFVRGRSECENIAIAGFKNQLARVPQSNNVWPLLEACIYRNQPCLCFD